LFDPPGLICNLIWACDLLSRDLLSLTICSLARSHFSTPLTICSRGRSLTSQRLKDSLAYSRKRSRLGQATSGCGSLLLPVATVSVERVFSAMNLMKTDIKNNMGDKWMNDYLITFIEKKIFNTVNNEKIMQKFQNMKSRRGKLSSLA
jgi:hypothetical protein